MVIGIIALILLWLVVITIIFMMLNEFLEKIIFEKIIFEKIIFEKIIDILLTVLFGMILASLVSFLTYTIYETIFK